jgi:predicted CopG family antitoxin
MAEVTTIQVKKKVLEELRKAKRYERQTYSELILELARNDKNNRLKNQYDEFLHNIQQEKMKELWDNKEDEAWDNA